MRQQESCSPRQRAAASKKGGSKSPQQKRKAVSRLGKFASLHNRRHLLELGDFKLPPVTLNTKELTSKDLSQKFKPIRPARSRQIDQPKKHLETAFNNNTKSVYLDPGAVDIFESVSHENIATLQNTSVQSLHDSNNLTRSADRRQARVNSNPYQEMPPSSKFIDHFPLPPGADSGSTDQLHEGGSFRILPLYNSNQVATLTASAQSLKPYGQGVPSSVETTFKGTQKSKIRIEIKTGVLGKKGAAKEELSLQNTMSDQGASAKANNRQSKEVQWSQKNNTQKSKSKTNNIGAGEENLSTWQLFTSNHKQQRHDIKSTERMLKTQSAQSPSPTDRDPAKKSTLKRQKAIYKVPNRLSNIKAKNLQSVLVQTRHQRPPLGSSADQYDFLNSSLGVVIKKKLQQLSSMGATSSDQKPNMMKQASTCETPNLLVLHDHQPLHTIKTSMVENRRQVRHHHHMGGNESHHKTQTTLMKTPFQDVSPSQSAAKKQPQQSLARFNSTLSNPALFYSGKERKRNHYRVHLTSSVEQIDHGTSYRFAESLPSVQGSASQLAIDKASSQGGPGDGQRQLSSLVQNKLNFKQRFAIDKEAYKKIIFLPDDLKDSQDIVIQANSDLAALSSDLERKALADEFSQRRSVDVAQKGQVDRRRQTVWRSDSMKLLSETTTKSSKSRKGGVNDAIAFKVTTGKVFGKPPRNSMARQWTKESSVGENPHSKRFMRSSNIFV